MSRSVIAAVLAIVLMCVGGCGTTRARSTRLTGADFADIASAMAAQLRESDLLQDRSVQSEPWVIAMARVENLSGDFISVSEQWWLMEKVRSALPMQTLAHDKAIHFAIPVERLRAIRAGDEELAEAAAERAPTHRMDAVIRSVERFGEGGRTDLYETDFEIVDLGSGEVVWSGTYEIKRLAFGRSWD